MGHRLSRIYTRTGDEGITSLGDGTRAGKDSLRIEVMGEVDELNAILGVLLAHTLPQEAYDILTRIQHELFDLGAELCLPGQVRIRPEQATRLEQELDVLNEELEPLVEFILPGGHPMAAHAHVARTVCRRVERRLIALLREQPGNPASRQYVNRLSDLLFVLARWLNLRASRPDVLWKPAKPGA